MKRLRICALMVLASTSPFAAKAEERNLSPWNGLWKNTADSFTRDGFVFPLSAIGATVLISTSNIDANVATEVSYRSSAEDLFSPVVIGGFLAPPILAGGLALSGALSSNDKHIGAAAAVVQATLISVIQISTLKFFTGRPNLEFYTGESIKSQSKTFHFGLGRGGIVYGWPSGHASVVMAMGSCLTHYYPDSLWLKYVAYGAAAYTATAVTVVDYGRMHWLSDAVAGLAIGYSIGSTVGSRFRTNYQGSSQNETSTQSAWTAFPLVSSHGTGMGVSYRLGP